MKVTGYAVLGLALMQIFFSADSFAASSDVKLGYVDLQRALTESRAGKKAQQEYEKAVEAEQGRIDKKKTEFERLRDSFDKQSGSLNEEALTVKQEELLQKERDIKRSFKDSQDNLRRKNAKMVQELLRDMRKAVAEVGEERGFTIILEKGSQAVLYADNSIDITEEVVKRFDKRSSQ